MNDQTTSYQRNINYHNINNHQREPQYKHQRREQQFATPYIYYLLIRECSKSSIIYMLL